MMTDALRSAQERRIQIIKMVQTETGIDEEMIEALVRGFYQRVRQDVLLGPIFASRIPDWEPHLQKMFAFWSSLTLQSGRYHGQPMAKHLTLPVSADHFDRWLALFEQTTRELCPPAAAELFINRARRVAESLELGVAGAHGVLLPKGERYQRST
jgi:hemoglobin